MEKPLMYRKRYIPDEIKSLNDDEILFINDEVIVTRWKTFKPKKEFSNGISYTFLNRGYKISKFMNDSGETVYYYCDIINSEFQKEKKHLDIYGSACGRKNISRRICGGR